MKPLETNSLELPKIVIVDISGCANEILKLNMFSHRDISELTNQVIDSFLNFNGHFFESHANLELDRLPDYKSFKTAQTQERSISEDIRNAYFDYFNCIKIKLISVGFIQPKFDYSFYELRGDYNTLILRHLEDK
jgi:hypothetical protein